MGRGGLELDADWSIDDRKRAELRPTLRPFRPATSKGMQQVRVRVLRGLGDRFDVSLTRAKVRGFQSLVNSYIMTKPSMKFGFR